MPAPDLLDCIDRALDRRADLLARLATDDTDCYRLFHGVVEGEPGLAIDRYGPLLLLQTWREPLGHDEAERLGAHVAARLGIAPVVAANHRGAGPGFGPHDPGEPALQPHVCREGGLRFSVRARHRGADPWLFLDLRAGRAALRRLAAGRSVLNLFAYTCSAGVAALAGGALHVTNVDFARSALAVGADNHALNEQQGRADLLQADCLAVLRQLAGQPVQRRGRHRPFARIEPRPFDAVFLDPPRWSRGPFGAVDVVRDYASLFKPSLLTLAPDGVVVATNHVPEVAADEWCEALRRCAAKAGRPLRDLELVRPDGDFPTFDGQPPLKIAICRV